MNEQLKSYKTVEQIAKKHRMDVSDIQKQLDMGAPIEHEHTNNQKLAVEIALQHLDEIPDYYTRLKKMEASAKKEHKDLTFSSTRENKVLTFSIEPFAFTRNGSSWARNCSDGDDSAFSA